MIENPKISVIICTYNRDKFLPGALEALTIQTLSKNLYEIIIINNNSTDNTETISKNFIDKHKDLNIKYFVETNKGLSAARNRGINEASSELVSFIDDDAEVSENYLKIAVDFFDNHPDVDAIGGKITPVFESGKEPEWLSKYMWGLVTKADFGNKVREYPRSKSPYGCSMAFRKKVLYEAGLFNTNLLFRSEDKYIFYKLREKGKKFLYHPEFTVKHHIDDKRITYESIMKISYEVGSGERDRLHGQGIIKHILKVAEYKLKLFAALFIALGFFVKFDFKKGEYLIKNRWLTLIGFFKV
ncbi:MAG: glycosyltransferase family 2 protein [Ignavibacteria bacterium]|nr:glycosyltransferase family 2 protein [Ignavibacteria bacterium]